MKLKFLSYAKPYLFIAPAILFLSVFWIYPIFEMINLSFVKWNLVSPIKEPVGLENYINLFQDPLFYQTLLNTCIYTLFNVFFGVGFGLLLALFLHKNTKSNAFLQSILFSPYIVSLASIALLWIWLMNYDFGLLNAILNFFHIPPIDWLGKPQYALGSLILISVWKSVGYDTLILISSLHSIPPSLYEAAMLDHASSWRTFTKITLPMISPTVFFLTIVDVIASFKVFETIQIITQGGPQNSTNTLVFSLYEYGFSFYKIGYSATIGVVLMVFVSIFTLIYFRVLSKKIHYH